MTKNSLSITIPPWNKDRISVVKRKYIRTLVLALTIGLITFWRSSFSFKSAMIIGGVLIIPLILTIISLIRLSWSNIHQIVFSPDGVSFQKNHQQKTFLPVQKLKHIDIMAQTLPIAGMIPDRSKPSWIMSTSNTSAVILNFNPNIFMRYLNVAVIENKNAEKFQTNVRTLNDFISTNYKCKISRNYETKCALEGIDLIPDNEGDSERPLVFKLTPKLLSGMGNSLVTLIPGLFIWLGYQPQPLEVIFTPNHSFFWVIIGYGIIFIIINFFNWRRFFGYDKLTLHRGGITYSHTTGSTIEKFISIEKIRGVRITSKITSSGKTHADRIYRYSPKLNIRGYSLKKKIRLNLKIEGTLQYKSFAADMKKFVSNSWQKELEFSHHAEEFLS